MHTNVGTQAGGHTTSQKSMRGEVWRGGLERGGGGERQRDRERERTRTRASFTKTMHIKIIRCTIHF